jgi:hypothetical protein
LFFKKLVNEYGYTEEEARRMVGDAFKKGIMTQRGFNDYYRKQLRERTR